MQSTDLFIFSKISETTPKNQPICGNFKEYFHFLQEIAYFLRFWGKFPTNQSAKACKFFTMQSFYNFGNYRSKTEVYPLFSEFSPIQIMKRTFPTKLDIFTNSFPIFPIKFWNLFQQTGSAHVQLSFRFKYRPFLLTLLVCRKTILSLKQKKSPGPFWRKLKFCL